MSLQRRDTFIDSRYVTFRWCRPADVPIIFRRFYFSRFSGRRVVDVIFDIVIDDADWDFRLLPHEGMMITPMMSCTAEFTPRRWRRLPRCAIRWWAMASQSFERWVRAVVSTATADADYRDAENIDDESRWWWRAGARPKYRCRWWSRADYADVAADDEDDADYDYLRLMM